MKVVLKIAVLLLVGLSIGCITCSHLAYARRAGAARVLPEGTKPRPGRIYFASFPENRLAISIFGWHANVGHAALVTCDLQGMVKQYDYGWFVGRDGESPSGAIGYVDENASYGVVTMKYLCTKSAAASDTEIARMVLDGMPGYGDKVELWGVDVNDVGIAERYMEQLAQDENRGSMAWRCWQIGGYRCGNITRQAFDAARGEGHFLDLLWGGFPGADAPSIGTDKVAIRN